MSEPHTYSDCERPQLPAALGQAPARRPYHTPRLEEYGLVEELTHLGGSLGNEGNGVFAFSRGPQGPQGP